MTDIYFPVRSDLRRILLATPGVPTNIAWEGRKFTPATGMRWLQEMLSQAASLPATIGNIGYTYETMVYRIVVNDPPTTVGLSETENLVDAICAQFPVGAQVGSPTVFGRVIRSTRGQMTTDADWRKLDARITFFVTKPNAG